MSTERKKGFFEKIGLVTIIEDEVQPVQEAPKPYTPSPVVMGAVNGADYTYNPIGTSLGVQNIIATVDPAFVKHIEKAFENANIPGPDFYEFSKSLEATASMGEMIPAKGRYQMAFQIMTAQAPDLKKEYLIETGNKYVQILQNELADYRKELDSRREKEIGSRKEQIALLSEDNQNKAKQIEELTKQMQENQLKQVEINNEINIKAQEIDQKEKNFELVTLTKTNQITAELGNIESYINNPS